jgi:hypothetical protein
VASKASPPKIGGIFDNRTQDHPPKIGGTNPAQEKRDKKAGKNRFTVPPNNSGINIHTSGISRIKRFSPTPILGSRGVFETTFSKWFQKLHSDPRSRRGKDV